MQKTNQLLQETIDRNTKVISVLIDKLKQKEVLYNSLRQKKTLVDMELVDLKRKIILTKEKETKRLLLIKHRREYESLIETFPTTAGKRRELVYTRIEQLEKLLGIKKDESEVILSDEEVSDAEVGEDIDEKGNLKDFIEVNDNESDEEFSPLEEEDPDDHIISGTVAKDEESD